MYRSPHLILSIYLLIASTGLSAQENEATTATVLEVTNTKAFITSTQKTTEPIDLYPYKYVVNLKFYLNESETSRFIADVLYKNVTNHNITTSDLIGVTKISNLNYSGLESILADYDLSLDGIVNLSSMESLFRALDISIYMVYKELFSNFITDPRDKLPKMLEILEIDKNTFTEVILFGDDRDLFDLLKAGNLSRGNMEDAFAVADLTLEQLYEFMKPIFLDKLIVYPLSQLITDFKANKIVETIFVEILNNFNLKPADYYKYESFRNVFSAFINNINGKGFLGAVTGSKNIVTSLAVHEEYKKYGDFVVLYAEVVENSTLRYLISNFTFWIDGPTYLETNREIKTKYVEITESYEDIILNCTYVTVNDGNVVEIVTSHVLNNNKYLMKIMKNDNTTFHPGSLLVCKGKLYGIAKREDKVFIQFSTFYWDKENEDEQPMQELATRKPWISASSTLHQSTVLFFAIFVKLLLLG